MATLKLTDRVVQGKKPPAEGYVELWDSHLPGFGLRLSAHGKRSFQVMTRVNGRPVRYKLGTYGIHPTETLAAARDEARRVFSDAQKGLAPRAAKKAAALAAARARKYTFSAVAADYLADAAKDLRTKDELKRKIEIDLEPEWGERNINEITRADVKDVIRRKARTTPIAANRLLALISAIFNWALDEDIITASPAVRVRRPGTETERERVLSDAELRDVWEAAGQLGYPYGPIYRLAAVTGQRIGEVAGLRRSEIAGNVWSLPGERAKRGKGHAIYLAPLAQELLAKLPRKGDLLFTSHRSDDRKPTGFSLARRLLREKTEAVRQERGETEAMPEWTPHDLRRTCATGMRTLRIDRLTVSKVLNHAEAGVTKTYDRYSMDDERRTAWEAWARKIESIIQPGPDNVVQMVRA
ncbi:MAG: tyrosine-type recombinase/integrase [Dongiaceae bacterium]